jgi:hypothetical protein
MSGGFAATAGEGREDNDGRWGPTFEGTPGLRAIFEGRLGYAGVQFETCGEGALIVGDEDAVELEYWNPRCLEEGW